MLNNLFAPLVLDVQIDVRRLVALLGNEALEKHVDGVGRDAGDLQRVAGERIGRRAAPLAENLFLLTGLDDLPHRQKIAGVVELANEIELLLQLRGVARRPIAEAFDEPRAAQVGQQTVRGFAQRKIRRRIAVADVAESKIDGVGDGRGVRDCLGQIGKKLRHAARGFEVRFGVGQKPPARFVESEPAADAGQQIVDGFALGRVETHISRGHDRNPQLPRQRGHRLRSFDVARGQMARELDVKPLAEGLS